MPTLYTALSADYDALNAELVTDSGSYYFNIFLKLTQNRIYGKNTHPLVLEGNNIVELVINNLGNTRFLYFLFSSVFI